MNKNKVAYTGSILNNVERRPLNGEVQAQNFKSGRVYVFGNSDAQCLDDIDDDDNVFEMGNIRVRKANSGQKDAKKGKSDIQKVSIIHRQVFPNDTLSKFALQYGCTVAELKTTNNLYNEQDFHALKHIKIPIQPHSLLTERAEEERRRENAFGNHDAPVRTKEPSQGDNSDSDYENVDESPCPNVRTVSISANLKDTEKFLKRMDEDIQKICQSVPNREADPDDVNRKLTMQCIHPRQTVKKDSEELGMIWSDFGWKSAVAAFIFVAIILPLFYFIYIEKFKS